MKRILIGIVFVMGMSLGMVGCAEKTQVKETKTTTGPGGSTTETHTDEVKKTGDNKTGENPPPPSNP